MSPIEALVRFHEDIRIYLLVYAGVCLTVVSAAWLAVKGSWYGLPKPFALSISVLAVVPAVAAIVHAGMVEGRIEAELALLDMDPHQARAWFLQHHGAAGARRRFLHMLLIWGATSALGMVMAWSGWAPVVRAFGCALVTVSLLTLGLDFAAYRRELALGADLPS